MNKDLRSIAEKFRLEATVKEIADALGVKDEEVADVGERLRGMVESERSARTLAEETLLESRFREMVRERGVIDADAAGRLMDMSGVKVDLEKREVEGLNEAMEKLLRERPYLAGQSVAGGTPGGGTPRGRREREDDTLSGRVRKEFARRLPSGMMAPGESVGNMKIS